VTLISTGKDEILGLYISGGRTGDRKVIGKPTSVMGVKVPDISY